MYYSVPSIFHFVSLDFLVKLCMQLLFVFTAWFAISSCFFCLYKYF